MTNHATSQCYAQEMGDCFGRLTLEHPVSKAVLATMPKRFYVQGLSWCQTGRLVARHNLQTRTLCGHHNNALSPLDTEAGKLFAYLKSNSAGGVHCVDGLKLEAWFLKLLLGIVHSDSELVVPVPLYWLRLLFGQEPFAERCGLYVRHSHFMTESADLFDASLMQDSEVFGIAVRIAGLNFALSVTQPFAETAPGTYRPSGMQIGEPERARLAFKWPEYTGRHLVVS